MRCCENHENTWKTHLPAAGEPVLSPRRPSVPFKPMVYKARAPGPAADDVSRMA